MSIIVRAPNNYFTIEDQLKYFENNPRFGDLWTNWLTEKSNYISELRTIQNNFSEYSLHDDKHSRNILMSIESILGPERIKLLSPSDTWLILQCAYSHDIGMCVPIVESDLFITHPESENFKNIISNPNMKKMFQEIINDLLSNEQHDEHISSQYDGSIAAQYWQGNIDRLFSKDELFRLASFGQYFTYANFFYSIVIMEGFRNIHAKRSKKILLERIANIPSIDIIPKHLRKYVAEIVGCHTGPPESIMHLEKKANGFFGDYCHLRFVAALLRLGDLMDIDSTRFNPFLIQWRGKIYHDNMAYIIKDLSVVDLLLDTDKVRVKSSFTTEHVTEFLVKNHRNIDKEINKDEINTIISKSIKYMRSWMNNIQSNFLTYNRLWDDIAPENIPPSIPIPGAMTIYSDGLEVDPRDNDLKYVIDTRRAAEVIEGSGVYKNARLVFLREIIQNAVDATKVELLSDNNNILNRYNINSKNKLCFLNFLNENESLLEDYAITVDIILNVDKMIVKITDKGIGITRLRLEQMRHIGETSDITLQKRSANSPEWFRPTANFGIGLQSVFLLTDQFKIMSHPREKEYISGALRDMQRLITFSSVKLGGDITNFEHDTKNLQKLQNNGKEIIENPYPYGSCVTITVNLNEANDFIKSVAGHWINSNSVEYTYNLRKNLYDRICKFLNETLIDDIIPIHINFIGIENKKLIFNTTPFFKAIKIDDNENLRILNKSVYYWCEVLNNKNRKPFIALIKLSVPDGDYCKTRLYFRGIRFFQSSEVFKFNASDLFPGFDIDINIMSGNAHDFLEINRDKLKEDKAREFRADMFIAADYLFDRLCILIINYIKYVKKYSQQSQQISIVPILPITESTNYVRDSVYNHYIELMSQIDVWLYSSTAFSRNLFIYAEIKGMLDDAFLQFMTNYCGGSLYTVLFDKHFRKLTLVTEPILSYVYNIGENKAFIDGEAFSEDSEVDLIEDPRLTIDSEGNYKITKLLTNAYLLFAEYKFKKVEAYAIYRGGYATIYSLSEPNAMKNTLTEIDPDSFRIITTEIIRYYTKQLNNNNEDHIVDHNYFPMFPAPNFTKINDLSSAIEILAVVEQVADEAPHCDRRYNGFLVSPLPLGVLVELRYNNIMLNEKQALEKIDSLRKYRLHNDDEISGNNNEIIKDELPQLYDQLIRFILMKKINVSNRLSRDNQTQEILNAWAKFAEYLLALP